MLLVTLSAAILLGLGISHLALTFFSPLLYPRDPDLIERMRLDPLRLTRETTVWKAWVGFNASHSLGAILFGLVYGYLALYSFEFLAQSRFLRTLGLLTLLSYWLLGRRYWFSVPLFGISAACICYILGFAL